MNRQSAYTFKMLSSKVTYHIAIVLLLCGAAFRQVEGASGKVHLKLLNDLLDNYKQPSMRPINETTDSVLVGLRYAPILATLDETNEELLVRGMLVLKWNDYRLQWQPSDYEYIQETEVPLSFNDEQKIWIPEVSLYECLVTDFHSFFPETNSATLSYNGEIQWYTLATTKSYCPMDSADFPFDVQHCNLTFTTWLYDSNKQEFYIIGDLLENSTFEKYELHNILWSVKIANVDNNITTYECGTCKGKEQSYIQYTLELTRGNSDWLFTIFVYPCLVIILLISFVPCLLGGRDVDVPSYALTGLLTFFVFLTSLNSRIPATSASRLGLFILCGIVGGILAVVFAMIKLCVRDDTDEVHRVTGRRNYHSINDTPRCACGREQGRGGTIDQLDTEERSNENNLDTQSQTDRLLRTDGKIANRLKRYFPGLFVYLNYVYHYLALYLILYYLTVVIVIFRWIGSSE